MRSSLSQQLLFLGIVLFSTAVMAGEEKAELPGSNQPVEPAWAEAWPQTSQQPPQFINRLVLSDSAYLLQHAGNPIDWYPYADAAFDKAEQQNKLILLSIGYASCHWCHVMEAESFADLEVATELNKNFVAIKVDREQSPDVDAYYTMVVETIKGESGWPMTVVLTPDRRPVFAANYLSREQFLTVLDRLSASWQAAPQVLQSNADLISDEIKRRSDIKSQAYIRPAVAWEITAQKSLLADTDKVNGGFGHENKFPDELKLQFLLNAYKTGENPRLKEELITQLDSFMSSGMNDIVFGGVFRYTTDSERTRPHFEKMLYNQALTVMLFEDAASWLNKPDYHLYASSIIEFVNRSMRLEDGSFAAAIDADHDGEEGAYYLWPARILQHLPQGVLKVAIGEGGYYVYGSSQDSDFNDWQKSMRQQRGVEPHRIDNRITAWNALWISALLAANRVDDASRLAGVLWASAWDDKRLGRMPGQAGFLDDYGYFSAALWQLYLKTAEPEWKHKARILDQALLDHFYRNGVLSYGGDQDLQFAVDIYQDRELPSPVSMTLQALANHQTDVEYAEAFKTIKNSAFAQVGDSPEYYPTLVQMSFNYPLPEKVFAKGHGLISLHLTGIANEWQLVINLDAEWHINANKVNDSSLVPLQINSETAGMTLHYPESFVWAADFSESPLNIFSDETVIRIQFPAALEDFQVQIQLQACSDRICLLPELINLGLKGQTVGSK